MFINTRKLSIKLFFIFVFLLGFIVSVNAQTVECPKGFICLTQEEANKAAENTRVRIALEAEVKDLKEAVKISNQNTEEVKETGRKNVTELTDRLHKTEIELARTNGQLTAKEAELVRLSAWFDFVMKNGRIKQSGLFNIKF